MQLSEAALAASPPHPSLGCLASSSLAAHQARRPAGASSPSSSRHGVGYSPAISDPERRILCQHHDGGGGEPGRRADGRAGKQRRRAEALIYSAGTCEALREHRPACTLAPPHRPVLARGPPGGSFLINLCRSDRHTPPNATFPAPLVSFWQNENVVTQTNALDGL